MAYVANINYNGPNSCHQNDFNGNPMGYSNGQYESVDSLYGGNGYWVYDNTACNIEFEGPAMSGNIALSKGWNIFGVASAVSLNAIASSCNIVSGPFLYDSASSSYYSTTSLEPGVGYFIYVSSNCNIMSS